MGVITSQVSIRRIKEERLFLSPLSRNNHTFHSRGITLSSSEFVCIKTRMGLNIRVNSFVNGALTENLKEWSLNRLESQVQFLASITVHIVNEWNISSFNFLLDANFWRIDLLNRFIQIHGNITFVLNRDGSSPRLHFTADDISNFL